MKTKKISFGEKMRVLFWINHLPALLVVTGVLVAAFAVYRVDPFFNIFRGLAIGLFLLLPFCTYTPSTTFRKLLTMGPGFVMIVAMVLDIWWFERICMFSIGSVGAWFFIRDYKRQYTKYRNLRKREIDWFFDKRLLKRYLNSKCSRQVFLRTADQIDPVRSRELRKTVREEWGQKWYHFFPTSPKPLVGIFFPKAYEWLIQKLNSYGIPT
ncbi:hypothetical protein KC866_01775 [Patescibacteria group bacterium]|nr:hypothetical protein [Patescibacteria group bacterium]